MSCEMSASFFQPKSDNWPLDIHTAASFGDIMYFVKYDTGKLKNDIELVNSSGWTPLMYACGRGHSSLVNYLLISGAQKKSKTKSGVTPLMLAIASGNMPTVQSVFDSSNIEDEDYRKWTPIFYAVHFAREKCLSYLLQKGANVNVVDYQNESPLMMAIKIGRESMVELILQFATNLNVLSYKQETALSLANESNNPRIKFLVQERYRYLQNSEPGNNNLLNGTPSQMENRIDSPKNSPSLTKHQLKTSKIKLGKSLMYSPGRAFIEGTSQSNKRNLSPWKLLPKKFWSPQPKPRNDVETFLEKLGLEKYWPIFRDEEVDFETLMTLNDENLIELGIKLLGPRRKIMLAIRQLKMNC